MSFLFRILSKLASATFCYRPDQIDAILRHRGTYFKVGLALVALAILLPAGMKYGALMGLMLINLSAYSLFLRKWRTEPGLWMLAGLCYLIFAVAELNWLYERFHPAPQRAAAQPDRLRAIEVAIAAWLFLMQVRLMLSITVENWRATRSLAGSPDVM